MRRCLMAVLILMMMVVIPGISSAGSQVRLYVWDGSIAQDDSGELPVNAICWKKIDDDYYLFLPSGLDASNLRLQLTGADSIKCGDVTVNSGDVTDLFLPGTEMTIECENKSYHMVVMQSSNVASVYIQTESGKMTNIAESKKNEEAGSWIIMNEKGEIVENSPFEYVRGHGNSSFKWDKIPLHIRLNEKTNILGMGKAKIWLLIPSYRDNSMIRNAVTYDLAEAAGMSYTSQYRFADVYLNREYYGTYILTEKVQVGKKRVNITNLEDLTQELNRKSLYKFGQKGEVSYTKNRKKYYAIPNNPEDITGGYLLMAENDYRYFKESKSGFVTKDGQAVVVKSPEYCSEAQIKYISGLVQSFENAIDAEDGIDAATGKHFFDIVDQDSLVKKYLIEEITKNLDANKTSYYFYKDVDSVSEKLYWGPVWDYDCAWGMFKNDQDGYDVTSPEGLFAATDDHKNYFWYPKLYKHQEFVDAVKEMYKTTFRPLLLELIGEDDGDSSGQLKSFAEYETMLTDAAAMNFTRWPTFNSPEFPYDTGADFSENIEYLRTFLKKRVAYLDSVWMEQ